MKEQMQTKYNSLTKIKIIKKKRKEKKREEERKKGWGGGKTPQNCKSPI